MTLSTFLFLLIPGSLIVLKLAVMAFAIAWIARSFYQPGKYSRLKGIEN
jgi:hypothetical protein